MTDHKPNPFERYDLDPREGPQRTTERLRELAEDAKDEPSRAEIRAAWEELTMHPARRLRAAFMAHPETRAPIGAPPAREPRVATATLDELTLADLAVRPLVCSAFATTSSPQSETSSASSASLDDDPILTERR